MQSLSKVMTSVIWSLCFVMTLIVLVSGSGYRFSDFSQPIRYNPVAIYSGSTSSGGRNAWNRVSVSSENQHYAPFYNSPYAHYGPYSPSDYSFEPSSKKSGFSSGTGYYTGSDGYVEVREGLH